MLGNFPFSRIRSLCVVLSLGVLFIFNVVDTGVDSVLLTLVALFMVGVAGVGCSCSLVEGGGGGGGGGVDASVVGIAVYKGGEKRKVDEIALYGSHA